MKLRLASVLLLGLALPACSRVENGIAAMTDGLTSFSGRYGPTWGGMRPATPDESLTVQRVRVGPRAGTPMGQGETLRIEPGVASELRRMGFERIEQLIAAPRAPLAKRFGQSMVPRVTELAPQATGAFVHQALAVAISLARPAGLEANRIRTADVGFATPPSFNWASFGVVAILVTLYATYW